MGFPEEIWSIGIDVGTSSSRVCITIGNGLVTSMTDAKITSCQHPEHPEFITQSSTQIWEGIKHSLKLSLPRANKRIGKIKGVGVDATCSLVVLQKKDGRLIPYPVDFGFKNSDQNVVLWMDSRPRTEALELNKTCEGEDFMELIGGSFLPEMGVPKLKYLVDRIPKKDLCSLLFMELHDYVSVMLMTEGDLHLYQTRTNLPIPEHAHSELALDGSTKGWSKRLLEKFGLSQLTGENFALIGRPEAMIEGDYLPVPFAGERVGTVCERFKEEVGLPLSEEIYIGHGVIDCYAGWISTVKDLDTTLSMVAGTSTCFLIASADKKKIVPGVWGPFNNLVQGNYISEAGASATGALIEHLFKSHPAHSALLTEVEKRRHTIFYTLDSLLDEYAQQASVPTANHLVKHKFLYGEILGNRTPYADPDMRAAFIGESSDLSIKDLALKYLVVLEFLALQARQMVDTLREGGYTIDKISMSGSQFWNKRLVSMVEAATGVEVVTYQLQYPMFTVVRGASMLGLAAAHNTDVCEVMQALNSPQEKTWESIPKDSDLAKILNAKYEIMLDMAESQRRYRNSIDKALA